jgi:hypothetical protein
MSAQGLVIGGPLVGRLAAAMAAAVVLSLVVVSNVGAATPITFGSSEDSGLQLGSACINGWAASNAAIRIVWKSSSGSLKARVDMTTSIGGTWQYCSDTKKLRVGDTIKAVVEGTSRTLTMPNVSIASDRSTEFHGRGPASQDGDLWYSAGIFADYQKHATVSSDATGRWSVLAESPLMGGLYAEVEWNTPQDDWVGARMETPFVKVTLGASNVSGGGEAAGSAVVKLRDPSSNSLRGRAVLKFDGYGTGDGQFVDPNGAAVSVRVGDRIVSKLVAGLDWHVPDVTGSADVDNDLVSGQCYATEISPLLAEVRTYRAGKAHGFVLVDTDANGVFTADFNGRPTPGRDPANIKPGDQITIGCYYNTGDIVAMEFLVP